MNTMSACIIKIYKYFHGQKFNASIRQIMMLPTLEYPERLCSRYLDGKICHPYQRYLARLIEL